MARDLNAIMREDAKRRNARQAAEDAALASMLSKPSYVPQGIDPYHYSRSIRGRYTNGQGQRKVHAAQASDNCWNRGMRGTTIGTAVPFDNGATESTVMVYHADGTTEVKQASAFRKENLASKQTRHQQVRATKRAEEYTYTERLERFGAVGTGYNQV